MYSSAVFLDIPEAFHRVWHLGLFYKLKKLHPAPFYFVFKSYLNLRQFCVNGSDKSSSIGNIRAGIPQGSMLEPVLYTIFTSDMPITTIVKFATYADDTAIIASNAVGLNRCSAKRKPNSYIYITSKEAIVGRARL